MNQSSKPFLFPKLLGAGEFTLKSEKLTAVQVIIIAAAVILSIAAKIYLIPFNMMDMGDSATRVWNALWWAQKPFFIMPESGHPCARTTGPRLDRSEPLMLDPQAGA